MRFSRPAVFWRRVGIGCFILFGAAGYAAARSQNSPPGEADGRELFTTYCASCHGTSGEGNGPAAAAMRRTPPDITRIALTNGGAFPTDRVRRIIDGREVEAHGDRDMPVWGDAFKATRSGRSEASVRARIEAIVRYLMSIQRRMA
jgi:mono/diheme cytochrome c family protein